MQLDKLKPLVEYWAKSYDWRKAEAKLNALPNFITKIDGLDIHFIHVRSRHANALPMLMPHGWPGSVFELLKVVDPLVNPIPVAVSIFPDEIDALPRSWAERAYPNLIHYNKVDKGGHFAAWEQPQLLSQEVRAGFRSLR